MSKLLLSIRSNITCTAGQGGEVREEERVDGGMRGGEEEGAYEVV